MLTVRFSSAFPNQWLFDDEGNPSAPGARELADAIVAALRKQPGVTELTPVAQHENYGWIFSARYEDCTIRHFVNPIEQEAEVTLEVEGYLRKKLLLQRPGRTLLRYQQLLASTLNQIPQISDVQLGAGVD